MDNEKLISKKQLLQKYGISYGSLYRWKRMGLIPEAWFIKTSTSTGQETFFHEETICQRIEEILSRKDSTSLESLAKDLQSPPCREPVLILSTPYGTQRFPITEILCARRQDGTDITRELYALLTGQENEQTKGFIHETESQCNH